MCVCVCVCLYIYIISLLPNFAKKRIKNKISIMFSCCMYLCTCAWMYVIFNHLFLAMHTCVYINIFGYSRML